MVMVTMRKSISTTTQGGEGDSQKSQRLKMKMS